MRVLLTIILFFVVKTVYPQDAPSIQVHAEELTSLYKQYSERSKLRRQEAMRLAIENDVPLVLRSEDGAMAHLKYFDDSGTPVYVALHNIKAAETTNTNKLQLGGELGLDLTGEGLTIGIWDGGRVKPDHPDLLGRIFNKPDAATASSHATHVTGTVVADGKENASAMGMATKANALVYDFSNDDSEMTQESLSGMILSNHSYGLITGWRLNNGTWTWNGRDGDDEDYKFGFYTSSESQSIDQIAYNAPYHTIVWSAGNDRNDVGDNPEVGPPDGPWDCIGPEGTAKNNITVGAIEAISGGYTKPSDVRLSDFSSTGPVDDGRIKPDIVGMGVSVFSTDLDGYSIKQGTSMSAPNVTGSIALLQELYKREHNKFMKSATVKSLIFHTANEAGPGPGPDYMHGWGLLNAESAALHILQEDGANKLLVEDTLKDGEVFEYTFWARRGEKITATIAWTDPAGTPVSPIQVDPINLMLVNDLDMRILDDGGNEYKPWILDPLNPNRAATTGDNFRDNAEQVVLASPEARQYTLRINHKGTLENGEQPFTLAFTAVTEEQENPILYWVNGNGNWDDADHWSLTSGGPGGAGVPDASTMVVFDENSLVLNDVVLLSKDETVSSMLWLTKVAAELDLNGFELMIGSSLEVSSDSLQVLNEGSLVFEGLAGNNEVNLNANDLSGAELRFDKNAAYKVIGDTLKVRSINHLAGVADLSGLFIQSDSVISSGGAERSLNLAGAALVNPVVFRISGEASEVDFTGTRLYIGDSLSQNETSTTLVFEGQNYTGTINVFENGRLSVEGGQNIFSTLAVAGTVEFDSGNSVTVLNMNPGSMLVVSDQATLTLTQNSQIFGEAGSPVSISSDGKGFLRFDGHIKVCMDYLSVTNVDIDGEEAAVSAGENSEMVNAENWQQLACENILFADFETLFPCQDAMTEFHDLSSGAISQWIWSYGDASNSEIVGNEQFSFFTYSQPGDYEVELTVSDGQSFNRSRQTITIVDNTLIKPEIVENPQGLVSTKSGQEYRWFLDDERIDGATERIYDPENNAGAYRVWIADETCNQVSESYIVTSIADNDVLSAEEYIKIYPNPVLDNLKLEISLDGRQQGALMMIDALGRPVISEKLDFINTYSNDIALGALPRGIYLIHLKLGGDIVLQKRIIKE